MLYAGMMGIRRAVFSRFRTTNTPFAEETPWPRDCNSVGKVKDLALELIIIRFPCRVLSFVCNSSCDSVTIRLLCKWQSSRWRRTQSSPRLSHTYISPAFLDRSGFGAYAVMVRRVCTTIVGTLILFIGRFLLIRSIRSSLLSLQLTRRLVALCKDLTTIRI